MKNFVIRNLIKIQEFATQNLKTEWVIFGSDMLAAFLGLYITLRITLGKDIQALQMSFILKHCFVFSLISFGLFFWLRSDQGALRYTTMEKIPNIIGCAVLANLFYHPLMLLMGKLPPLTPVLNTFLFIIGLLLPRLIAPFWKREEIKTGTAHLSPKIPVIIVGYNEQIGAYLRNLEAGSQERSAFPYHLEGILLTQPLGADDLAPPFPVLGMVNDFVSIVQKLSLKGCEPKRLLITQESLSYLPLRQLLLKFQGRGILSLCFEISPVTHDVTLRPLQLEDLLGSACLSPSGQPSPPSAWKDVQAFIDSTRVLIIGIHDSVIHQLAHHMAGFYPKRLVMVDPSEQALAALKLKFDQLYPDIHCEYVLASITEQDVISQLIKKHHPQIVIQGDRVTHPDLVASNLALAVQKNILSPLSVAQQVQKTEACLFVLVNAQAPTQLTRLITRLVSQQLQSLDQAATSKTSARFLVINSGDVWNNLDSATAFWAEQLAEGLKIILPSPDAYSYLLSAKEAARMILQAIVKALETEKTKGQSLHFSGGEPSRLLDLIQSLSLLNGFIPQVDARITFSGKPMPEAPYETTELFQPFTPGMFLEETNLTPQNQDDSLLTQLTGFLEKKQTSKLVALLEKVRDHEESADATPLKLAG